MANRIDRTKIIQLIHVAKRDLGLSSEDYKAVLESVSGKTSCADMSLFELDAVLGAMKKLGFKVKKLKVKENEIGWDTSEKQMAYIKGLWELSAQNKSDEALYKFIRRITGAAHPRFMTADGAKKVIIALRKMTAAKGLNPDRKEA